MKHLLLSCFAGFLLLAAAFFSPARASHYVGSDFSYAPISGVPGAWLVTFKFYRDCSGITGSQTLSVEIFSPGCSTLTNAQLPLISVTDVTDVCSGTTTSCNDPLSAITGVECYTYADTVFLPSTCSNWTLIYESNARNDGIINLNNGMTDNLSYHIDAYLYTSAIQNTSPDYSANPVPYFCVNDTVTYNPQASDAEGDSLVFSLIPALGASGMPIVYTPGYSAQQPFGANANFTFDPATGQMQFIPTQIGAFVLALRVDEYRTIGGVVTHIGRTRRDVQVQVVSCSTPCPMAGGQILVNGNGQSGGAIALAEAGQSLQISIPATTTNANLTLQMTSNCANEIPGSAFTVTGSGSSITGHFAWTPDASVARNTPYFFTYHVQDNACPFPNERYGVVQVKVTPDTTVVGASQTQVTELLLPNLLQKGQQWQLPAELGNVDVQLFDVTGKLVFTSRNYNHTWSGQGASRGLYLYQIIIRDSGQVLSGKLQLQ